MERLKGKFLDFKYTLYYVWKELGLPEPTPLQYDLADNIQNSLSYLLNTDEDGNVIFNEDTANSVRKIIQAYRGIGKTWITATACCWLLRINPNLKIIIVSATKDYSIEISTFLYRLITDIELFQPLMPSKGLRNSRTTFDVSGCRLAKSPSVKARGLFGQVTGSRADLILCDDIEVPELVETQLAREKLRSRFAELEFILKPHGSTFLLGTPHAEESLYDHLVKNNGYERKIWTVKFPKVKDLETKYFGQLANVISFPLMNDPELEGKPTDPLRFTEDELNNRLHRVGRTKFTLQYMLDTSLSDAEKYPLKLKDLVVMDLNATSAPEKIVWCNLSENKIIAPSVGFRGDGYYSPALVKGDWLDYTGSVLAIDPSGRGKDETGYAVVKILNSYLFLIEWGGLKGGYDNETLETLADIAKKNKVNMVLIENNFGDGMFTSLIKPYLNKKHPCAVDEVRSVKQKELRIIDTLEPLVNQHRLIVNRSLIQKDIETTRKYPIEDQLSYSGFYQFTHLTKDRGCLLHDDRLDALAHACEYWIEQMDLNEDDMMKNRQEELTQAAIDNYLFDTQICTLQQQVMGMTLEQMKKSSSMNFRSNQTFRQVR